MTYYKQENKHAEVISCSYRNNTLKKQLIYYFSEFVSGTVVLQCLLETKHSN